MGGYARGWQGRRRRVSGRASALRARLALAGPRPFCRDGRRDFVYSCLVDAARGRDLRVVDSAELVVAMRESPQAVTAAVVTFDVPVGADNERHDRGQREEFDQAGRPDDRLAKERCQHCG